jgi:hypothetical protein
VTFLDHDEMLSDPFSLSRKIQALRGGSERVLALSTGYQLNEGSKTSNHYASEFGDPASFFMYRFSALSSRRLRDLLSRYEICQEDEQYFVLGKCQSRRPALVEYVAMGGVLDKSRFCKIFRGVEIDKNVLINGFSQIDFGCTKTRFVVMKNDHVIHETAESWAVVMRKIRWRTINFLSDPYGISASGLRGRLLGRSKNENFRSFIRLALFGLYVVLVIPVALDSLVLSITRRKWGYLMHFVLSFYVLAVVCQSFALRQIKSSRLYRNYDGSSRVGSL